MISISERSEKNHKIERENTDIKKYSIYHYATDKISDKDLLKLKKDSTNEEILVSDMDLAIILADRIKGGVISNEMIDEIKKCVISAQPEPEVSDRETGEGHYQINREVLVQQGAFNNQIDRITNKETGEEYYRIRKDIPNRLPEILKIQRKTEEGLELSAFELALILYDMMQDPFYTYIRKSVNSLLYTISNKLTEKEVNNMIIQMVESNKDEGENNGK